MAKAPYMIVKELKRIASENILEDWETFDLYSAMERIEKDPWELSGTVQNWRSREWHIARRNVRVKEMAYKKAMGTGKKYGKKYMGKKKMMKKPMKKKKMSYKKGYK